MKKFIAALILSVILTTAGTILAAGLKIGYVDVAMVFDQYSETKKAKLALEKEIKSKQDAIQKMSDELKNLRQGLEAQQATLSADDKKTKLADIDGKAQDLQKFTEESEGDLTKKESDLTQGILAKIYAAVQAIGKDKGYTLILDKNSVIYGADSWNITDDVVKSLEDQAKGIIAPILPESTTGYSQTKPVIVPSSSPVTSPYQLKIKEE